MGLYSSYWKNTIIFLFFRVQMESILPVEQLMVLSTFQMLLLENWFTPFKVFYALILISCDTEPFAVSSFTLSSMCDVDKTTVSLCCTYACQWQRFSLHGQVCIKIIISNLHLAYGQRNMVLSIHCLAFSVWDRNLLFTGHAMRIRSFCFSPDSQLLLTASDDGHMKLYDV